MISEWHADSAEVGGFSTGAHHVCPMRLVGAECDHFDSRLADVLIEPPESDQRFRANRRQMHRALDVVITYPCSESAMAKCAANWGLTAANLDL